MNKVIIVPIDDSPSSHKALEFALEIAEGVASKIILLNVQPNIETVNVRRFFSKEEVKEYLLEVGQELLEKTDTYTMKTNVPIEKEVRIGNPKAEICALANEVTALCIIMGSRGLGPIKGSMLGSVSYGVLHESPCPVTIVP